MSDNELHTDPLKINDLVTKTAIKSLIPQDNKFAKKENKTPTQLWLESQCDCA